MEIDAKVQATAATTAAVNTGVAVSDCEEFGTVEVLGNFRGYWRDVPRKDKDGKPVADKDGKQIVDRQFKLTRSVKLNGKVIRQAAWLNEADAKKHGFEDGVKYHLRLSVGELMAPSKSNDGTHADEYSLADPMVIEVLA